MSKPNPNSKPPTMRDVARLAGVSQPTVSRVLNDASTTVSISEETRQKILEAVKELRYRPNMTARSLRTQQSQMIALMIADISNAFYHPIARVIQDVARQHDYDVIIANSDHRDDNERHFLDAVIRRPVDGVIMVPIHLTDEDIDRFITLTQTPVVVIGKQIEHPQVDVVWADDGKATYEAITWLIKERGYSQVGYFGIPDLYPPGPRRWRGYQRAMEQAGLTIEPDYVSFEGDFTLESGRRAARKLLAHDHWPPVIFAVNDLMAIGLILELQDAGYSVPDDIAIMGFDDIPEASIIRPHLTTMAQTPVDIGRKLAEALFDRIEGRETGSKRILECPCRLVPRQSA
ncbi:MAG: LacI family DNA-binding transcriptional regulator [Chloroflexi bacterium]|nr:LacI family DNA-binding transcriptional regulator [Chloroflexota bacterium]